MRTIWSGSLSFGLITLPVTVSNVSKECEFKFHCLDKHGHCPSSYLKVCRGTKHEAKYENIARGYEYRKGDYVILADDDSRKGAPRKTKIVDIVRFADENEMPSKYIERPYVIEPDARSERAYVLLREALKHSKKIGIAKFALRTKERTAMIKPEGRALMLILLREDGLRRFAGLRLPVVSAHSKRELDMTLSLIRQLQEHLKASSHQDAYREEIRKLIAKKSIIRPISVSDNEKLTTTTEMHNLMETLRKSLEQEKRRGKTARRIMAA